jgi:hypothetical protein
MVTDCFEVCGLVVGQLSTKNANENLPEVANGGEVLQLILLNVCAKYQK